jgi:hypothetical protein
MGFRIFRIHMRDQAGRNGAEKDGVEEVLGEFRKMHVGPDDFSSTLAHVKI